MIGVNISNLDTLINKNNLYLNSYDTNSKRLINYINDLNECYSGSSLEYLFLEPRREIKNIQSISSVIGSYSTVLLNVKKAYQIQDQNFKNQINHMNSNL